MRCPRGSPGETYTNEAMKVLKRGYGARTGVSVRVAIYIMLFWGGSRSMDGR